MNGRRCSQFLFRWSTGNNDSEPFIKELLLKSKTYSAKVRPSWPFCGLLQPFQIFQAGFQQSKFVRRNWHELAAFQRSLFGRSAAGNDVVATILISLFSSPFSVFFHRCYHFSQKECSDQKTYLAKVGRSAQKSRSTPLSRPGGRPFYIFEVLIEAGGKVLQAVRRCRR